MGHKECDVMVSRVLHKISLCLFASIAVAQTSISSGNAAEKTVSLQICAITRIAAPVNPNNKVASARKCFGFRFGRLLFE